MPQRLEWSTKLPAGSLLEERQLLPGGAVQDSTADWLTCSPLLDRPAGTVHSDLWPLIPILLELGLATRLSALALFGMTLVIQLFVYPDALVPTHLGWFAPALAIATGGPGKISLDHLLFRRR